MKIRILLLVYVLNIFILAATHHNTVSQNDGLYHAYNEYSQLLTSENQYTGEQLNNIFSAFTHKKQQHLLSAQHKTPQVLQELVQIYLTFPQWIEKEYSHYEVQNGDRGCLVVNGYNQNLEPMTILVSYINNREWLIDDLQIQYLTPPNTFLDGPVCNPKSLTEIRV